MDSAIKTLFYVFESGAVDVPSAAAYSSPQTRARVLFLGARAHAALAEWQGVKWRLQQHFKPFADALPRVDFRTLEDIDCAPFDAVLVLVPKNRVESAYMIAQGLQHVKDGGIFVAAAANDAGGKGLVKMLQKFGCEDFHSVSKNKAKAVFGVKECVDEDAIHAALLDGAVQDILDGDYQSQPGVFGWDKIDQGSALLTQYTPQDLGGVGADFGCGYGYLSRHVLQHCTDIQKLYAIDADARALDLVQQNCKAYPARIETQWADLTQPQNDMEPLDFIIMNPPFHQGKHSDSDIGLAFINTAYDALKLGGKLTMVANAHLPYDSKLQQKFSSCDKLFEGQGFKIFEAVK